MDRQAEYNLIRLAAGGDRAAAGALIGAHQAQLYGYILRLSGRVDVAEDVVQDAFVRAISNLDRFDPRFRFSTWIFTIARRVYFNMRAKMRPAYDSDAMEHNAARADSPAITIARRDTHLRDALQRALMTLPDDQREIVVLFHQHDWPIKLICEQMNLPEGTVKSHLHRGRRRLRECMDQIPELARVVQEAWL